MSKALEQDGWNWRMGAAEHRQQDRKASGQRQEGHVTKQSGGGKGSSEDSGKDVIAMVCEGERRVICISRDIIISRAEIHQRRSRRQA